MKKALFSCIAAMFFVPAALAQNFTIADIIVDGYQRITPGIIYNLLPVGIGDEVTPQTPAQIHSRSRRFGVFRRGSKFPGKATSSSSPYRSGRRWRKSISKATACSKPRTSSRTWRRRKSPKARSSPAPRSKPSRQGIQEVYSVARALWRGGRNRSGGIAAQPGVDQPRHQRRRGIAHPPDQCRRQRILRRRHPARPVRNSAPSPGTCFSAAGTVIRGNSSPATWSGSNPSISTTATSNSTSNRRRSRSRPTGARCISPSTCSKATST